MNCNEYPIYPDALKALTGEGYIPRLLRNDEHLLLYKKYYFPDMDQKVKCTNIETYFGVEYYFLQNDTFQYVLHYPIDTNCYIFTLDKYDIMKRHIINDKQIYRGYQIRWWFFVHQKPKYRNFLELLPSISDDDIFKVYGELENGKYKECRYIKTKDYYKEKPL